MNQLLYSRFWCNLERRRSTDSLGFSLVSTSALLACFMAWTLKQKCTLAGVACLAAGLIGYRTSDRLRRERELDDEVWDLFCQGRWLEARLANCSLYRPCKAATTTHQGQTLAQPECKDGSLDGQLRQGWAALGARMRNQVPTTASGNHAIALYHLAWGQPKKAVEHLHLAIEREPANPRLRSDLSAALLREARQYNRPRALIEGLEEALTALAQPDAPVEARFNAALLIEDLHLDKSARRAWKAYIEKDPNSAWTNEATQHLLGLRGPEQSLVKLSDTQALRQRVNDGLASLADAEAEELIPRIDTLGTLACEIEESTGDALPREAVETIRQALDQRQSVAVEALVRGHSELRLGIEAYQSGDLEQAIVHLTSARQALSRQGSPFRHWATFYLACSEQQQEDYEGSLRTLRGLENEISTNPYLSLQAFVAWMQGLNHMLLGRLLESAERFRQSLAGFESSGEPENQAVIHVQMGLVLRRLGEDEEAWRATYRGLLLNRQIHHPRRSTIVYWSAAEAALDGGYLRVASMFHDLVARSARRTGNRKIESLALIARGLLRETAGEGAGARSDLEAVRRLAAGIPDASSRHRTLADLAALEARLDPNPDRTAAIERLTEALRLYKDLNLKDPTAINAYTTRAELLLKSGRTAEAAQDIEDALRLYEERVLDAAPSLERWVLHHKAQALYERLVRIELDRDDTDAAFRIAERARRFSLFSLDFRSTQSTSRDVSWLPDDVRRRLAPEVSMVFFAFAENELVTWVLDRQQTRCFRRRVDRRALRQDIAEFVGLLRSHGAQRSIEQLGGELFELLLADPLASAQGRALVLVPMDELHKMPFAELRRKDGQPLAANWVLSFAPSATLYLHAAERATRRTGARGMVLLVGDPAFDHQRWSAFLNLPGSRNEVRELAGIYPDAVTLLGKAASREALLRLAPQAELIHFAGHAVLNSRRPEESVLLLASEREDSSGALYQHEIYRLELAAAPLVVLSACESGNLVGESDASLSSLSRAFLSAGASAVVGSLWPVVDDSAAFLMVAFHRALREGRAPAEALRAAQLDYLGNERLVSADPHGWSAFQILGAGFARPVSPLSER